MPRRTEARAWCWGAFGGPFAVRISILLEPRLDLAQALDRGAAFLAFEAALARAPGRLGRPARDRRHRGALDQLDQPVERVLAVALLGAVALRGDHQHALVGEPPPGEALEPRAHVSRQRRRAAHVEAQLHRGRELVDVLPAGPRGADEALLELALVDADHGGDADHVAPLK